MVVGERVDSVPVAKKSGRKAGPRAGNVGTTPKVRSVVVARPYAGLAVECDLVAMREFIPSATAVLPVTEPGRAVTLATVLPSAAAALVRAEDPDGHGFVGIQTQAHSDDLSHDLGRSVAWAREAGPTEVLDAVDDGLTGPRLQELLAADAELEVIVHDDFGWWIPAGDEPSPEVSAGLERANQAIMPTAQVPGVRSAWWVDAGEKAHLRWVRPEDEDALMLALARVHAAGSLTLGEGSRYAGSFRAHGLLVPVFDLDRERHAQEWTGATAALGTALEEALADDGPLNPAQRRSRDGLRTRQVTIR